MEQHPVPQHISSYEFRLVGDMTLKQFMQLAGGQLVALIFYAMSIPAFIKWPLVLTSSLFGVALAFFPIEERPLEIWVVSFFRAVYSPTQFLWQKKPKRPAIFEEGPTVQAPSDEGKVLPSDKAILAEFISTMPQLKTPLDKVDEEFLGKIQGLFSSATLPSSITPIVNPLVEELKPAEVRIRKLHQPPWVEPGEVSLPRPAIPSVAQVFPAQKFAPPVTAREQKQIHEAKFTPGLLMPSISEIPNVLVGMVTDSEGKIVEGIIMEIRDDKGNPVRALKTNKLGQFRTVNPLSDGNYEIELEKEGYNFDLVKISLKGEIVQPIQIKAKAPN